MILLYRDPEGKTVGSTTKAASVTGNAVSQFETSNNMDWEKKVASLEKALREKDAKIALLMKSHNEKVSELISHFVYSGSQGISIIICALSGI